ncbi:hypothetical protein ABH973_006243 [Bradyrhizobium ottawaense]|uniref:hypothetical protein n=1 Tax=Bradyrhizobium ottawaense TaxID=931866 RepID=UPI0035145509
MSHGILSFLDPEVRARWEAERTEEERRRDYAVKRLAECFVCPVDVARAWLDKEDAEAIDTATRILSSELHTDAVAGWYH